MPSLEEWDASYSINVKKIDEQHKMLIEHINNLSDAMRFRKGKEYLAAVLDGLVDYARVHFASEENYFDKFDYPDSSVHKEEHYIWPCRDLFAYLLIDSPGKDRGG